MMFVSLISADAVAEEFSPVAFRLGLELTIISLLINLLIILFISYKNLVQKMSENSNKMPIISQSPS